MLALYGFNQKNFRFKTPLLAAKITQNPLNRFNLHLSCLSNPSSRPTPRPLLDFLIATATLQKSLQQIFLCRSPYVIVQFFSTASFFGPSFFLGILLARTISFLTISPFSGQICDSCTPTNISSAFFSLSLYGFLIDINVLLCVLVSLLYRGTSTSPCVFPPIEFSGIYLKIFQSS